MKLHQFPVVQIPFLNRLEEEGCQLLAAQEYLIRATEDRIFVSPFLKSPLDGVWHAVDANGEHVLYEDIVEIVLINPSDYILEALQT